MIFVGTLLYLIGNSFLQNSYFFGHDELKHHTLPWDGTWVLCGARGISVWVPWTQPPGKRFFQRKKKCWKDLARKPEALSHIKSTTVWPEKLFASS